MPPTAYSAVPESPCDLGYWSAAGDQSGALPPAISTRASAAAPHCAAAGCTTIPSALVQATAVESGDQVGLACLASGVVTQV